MITVTGLLTEIRGSNDSWSGKKASEVFDEKGGQLVRISTDRQLQSSI
jgi:hypothetical protein